jgi:hypothetical protein
MNFPFNYSIVSMLQNYFTEPQKNLADNSDQYNIDSYGVGAVMPQDVLDFCFSLDQQAQHVTLKHYAGGMQDGNDEGLSLGY